MLIPDLSANAERENVAKFWAQSVNHLLPDVMNAIVCIELIALTLCARTAYGRDIQHPIAELDESAATEKEDYV